MAGKKLTMDRFKNSRLDEKSLKKVRGGYKSGPPGAGFVGSFIWESIDIRSNQEGTRNFPELTFRRH